MVKSMVLPLQGNGRSRVLRLSLFLAPGIAALSACASVPPSHFGPPPKEATSLDADVSLTVAGTETAAAWPQEAWWQSYGDAQLDALITQGLADAPDMRAAQARATLAQSSVMSARANLRPTVSGTASAQASRQSYNLGFPLPEGWDDNGNAAINFGWELDFWGKNRAALAAATSSANAALAEQAAARIGLSTAIASAYAELAGLYSDHDAASEALRIRTRTQELMQQRQDNGLENSGAVRRAEAGKAAATAQLAAIDEAIALTKHAIAALVGAGPDRSLTITRPSAKLAQSSDLPNSIPAELLGRRADITAAKLRVEAAQGGITVAEKQFYPNISLTGLIGLQTLNLANFFQTDSLVNSGGAAISLPIFQGGRLKAGYRAAEAEYELAVAAYDGILTQALREVADAATSRKALDTRLSATREAHTAAQAAYTIANNRYRGGLATTLDVLSAEDGLIAARRDLAALETRALALDIALIRALGGGFGA